MDTLVSTKGKQTTLPGHSGKIFVDDGGSGDIPVVFVHSFGGSTEQWQAQLSHLRDSGTRAIAMDLPGHGRSDTSSKQDYAVETLARDIAAVVDSLKLKRFVLVGHSMGGSAAVAYTGKYPDRVAGLVLVGTPGKSAEEQSKPIIASLESDKYDKVMQDYMDKLLTNARPVTDKSEREGMKKISKQNSINIIKAVFRYDPLPALRKYQGPKLIISADGETQPNSLQAVLLDIPHQTIPGTSHWVQMDRPEEFNRILDEFLKSIASKPSK